MTGRTPALMIQGTGSDVGKSLIVAGLARLLADRGYRVAPFKPQNMSNNAGVAYDGGEIGRAQMLQARAARVSPSVHMNPVLLKPEAETGAQIVVQGERYGTLDAKDYGRCKARLLPRVLQSFTHLERSSDIILVEGAGSPAETNLRKGDIANMGFAEAAEIPVVIVGDIERGGVIASLVGTHAVLDQNDRERIGGFLINRFRGEPDLFRDGAADIVRRTGWASYGVIPHFQAAERLPAEDVLGLPAPAVHRAGQSDLRIAVPRLPRIANFDDLDPLRMTPGVEVVIVPPGGAMPCDAALIIVPGSKSTIADLTFVRKQGWDIDILAHVRRGGCVLGICGGYQMLGRRISDPGGIEGAVGAVEGLGLLDVETTLTARKKTRPVEGIHAASGLPVAGYEIHLGETVGPDSDRPFSILSGVADGGVSTDGLVMGTYMHGAFTGDRFREFFLGELGGGRAIQYDALVETTLSGLATLLAAHCDIEGLLTLARER